VKSSTDGQLIIFDAELLVCHAFEVNFMYFDKHTVTICNTY